MSERYRELRIEFDRLTTIITSEYPDDEVFRRAFFPTANTYREKCEYLEKAIKVLKTIVNE